MTEFLLILVGIAQIIQIVILILILRSIDKPDLSKEDADVKSAADLEKATTDHVESAIHNLPPQN